MFPLCTPWKHLWYSEFSGVQTWNIGIRLKLSLFTFCRDQWFHHKESSQLRDHSYTTFGTFSEKLTFLTPWHVDVLVYEWSLLWSTNQLIGFHVIATFTLKGIIYQAIKLYISVATLWRKWSAYQTISLKQTISLQFFSRLSSTNFTRSTLNYFVTYIA